MDVPRDPGFETAAGAGDELLGLLLIGSDGCGNALALDLSRQDDTIDAMNREIFRRAIDIGGEDADLREWAMSMVLVSRALERIGDNAVDIGEQTVFVVTGLFRELGEERAR